jgi:hypothetical protein
MIFFVLEQLLGLEKPTRNKKMLEKHEYENLA